MRLTRYVIGVAICLGIIVVPSFTQAPNSSVFRTGLTDVTSAARTGGAGTIRGIEAIHLLKEQKLYDSLAEAYQAALYSAEPNTHPAARLQSVVYHASNPAYGMDVDFANDGVRIAGESGSETWSWVVRLTAYGYGDSLQPAEIVTATANKNHIEYSRGVLTEWYVNDQRGLEQGFTLAKPPAASTGGPLMVTMAVDTELQGLLDRDGKKIAFVDSAHRIRLQYGNLRAWDASGKHLPATLQAGNGQITLRIDDSAAAYPVTIDPLMYTSTKLTASDATPGDRVGVSIAISGDTVVVGMSHWAVPYSSAAYVFVLSGGVWSQQQKLTPRDPSARPRDGFGVSVAIDGDTLVVGAAHSDYPFFAPGSAYVFVRSEGVWTEQQKLMPLDSANYDAFGCSVAISGDTIVVGADDSNMSAPVWPPGSAYIFTRTGVAWIQEAKLTPSDGQLQDTFGSSVAISGDGNTVVVGSPGSDSPSAAHSGTAYVYQRDLGSAEIWIQITKLIASDAAWGDAFGASVAISGSTIVVGAPYSRGFSGSVYVFVPNLDSWSEQKLTSNAVGRDQFGFSVAISGDTIVAFSGGVAYVFQNIGIDWVQSDTLTSSDATDPYLGRVAISGDTIATEASGPNSVGAAYVFTKITGLASPSRR